MSKHQQIIEFIEDLDVGEKVSVRLLSQKLSVSDGTAYRAIKEAERRGLVAVVDRAGTIRIATREQKIIERLTYEEIAKIANAIVLAGSEGMDREFNKFAIGAMTEKNLKKYLTTGGLLIVGDRTDIQKLALQEGNAVLITGGVPVDKSVLSYADSVNIPVMRTTFDTFTVAGRINRALSNELIKKDISLIGDVYNAESKTLVEGSIVKDYLDLVQSTNDSRFTVVSDEGNVLGVVSMRDVTGKLSTTPITKIMSRRPTVATMEMSVAAASQKMIVDGYEMMPVVNDENIFLGTVSRGDVLRSLQDTQEQSQFSHTMSDDVENAIHEIQNYYTFTVDPFMMDTSGRMSQGVLVEIMSNIITRVMEKAHNKPGEISQLNVYFMGEVKIDDELEIYPKIISENRHEVVVDIEIYLDYQVVSKGIATIQI